PRGVRARVSELGNPVRREVIEPRSPSRERERLGLDPARATLLVVGGSQGAAGINRAVVAAADAIARHPARPQVIHLSGAAWEERARGAYAAAGVTAHVAAFSTDMGGCYAAADLALARAGGTTIAELRARGLASVLVPYPHAKDDHQTANARALV